MMTVVQGVIPAQVKVQFDQYAVNNDDLPCQTLAEVTKTILHYAFWLADQKQKLPIREYKKLLLEQGWKGEEKKYLKIAAAFGKFAPQDVANIEPRTIYWLAENSKRYQQVIDSLLDSSEINQETIRSLTKKQRLHQHKKLEKPSIWRRTRNGGRYCQVPPIHETSEETGITLQKMMDEEGLSAQKIVAEAISLRQAYKEGQLVLKQ